MGEYECTCKCGEHKECGCVETIIFEPDPEFDEAIQDGLGDDE